MSLAIFDIALVIREEHGEREEADSEESGIEVAALERELEVREDPDVAEGSNRENKLVVERDQRGRAAKRDHR